MVTKTIQNGPAIWTPSCGFRFPGTGLQSLSMELGLWILIVSEFPDALSCIPDSKAQDSVFHEHNFSGRQISIHKQKFPGIQNPDFLTWGTQVPFLQETTREIFFSMRPDFLFSGLERAICGEKCPQRNGSKYTGWVFGNCGNRLPASAMLFCSASQL